MAPGETKVAVFDLEVQEGLKARLVDLGLAVADTAGSFFTPGPVPVELAIFPDALPPRVPFKGFAVLPNVATRLQGGANGPAPGASVRVLLSVSESRQAVVIPVSALRKGPEGDHVWVVTTEAGGAERVRERKVETGPSLGETVIVLAGLQPGEVIAASGSFKLREGLRVQAAEQIVVFAVRPREERREMREADAFQGVDTVEPAERAGVLRTDPVH